MKGAHSSPMSRGARIFVPVFVLASMAALAYVFAQPPVYVARARVQPDLPAGQQTATSSLLAKSAQTLTTNAMLESIWKRLGGSGRVGTSALHGMLSAEPVPDAGAIELRAEGADRGALLRILTAWIEAWQESEAAQSQGGDARALEEARGAVELQAQDVAARRGELEQFREKFSIDPSGGIEHPDVARLKDLEEALSKAWSREADAEARIKVLREGAAAGRALPGVPEAPAIAGLEKQAAEVRLAMRSLERDYTPLYLGLDPRYNALRSDLNRLEQQIEQEKQAGARQALQKAEEEAASARQAVARAREELAAGTSVAAEHSARVAEYSALAAEFARQEEAHAAAREQLAQLEKAKAAAGSTLKVLDRPAVPDWPDRPEYWREASLSLAGSAALGFLVTWLAGFFRSRERRQPGPGASENARFEHPAGAAGDAVPFSAASPVQDVAALLPTMSGQFSRELSGSEVHALWRAAAPDARIVIAGLLGGLSFEELAALRYEHVDFDACYVRVPGISGRSCTLRDPLRRLLIERRAARGGGTVLAEARGEALTVAEIDGLIARAAREAEIANAGEVTSETLRHTYFAYLVRQGARFAEIGEFIGCISPAAHREYSLLAPPGPGRPMEEIDPVFPVLRELR